MSKPTVKEIVAALRCRAGTEVVDCGKCLYQRDCDDPLFEDAADLIKEQEARIRKLEASAQEWIPLKWRKSTTEEKELYGDEVYIADCKLPDDGDEILISRCDGNFVSVVEFCNDGDYGIGDSDGNDWLTEVDAWMPLPKGYQKPAEEVANEVN